MLSLAMPYVDAWNEWHDRFGNTPDGIPAMRDAVDAACREASRDPAEVARTVTVYARMSGGRGRSTSYADATPPHDGTNPTEMAATLRKYADQGISHVQLVLDPITVESIQEFEPVLAALD
jgi:hypothetical protein